MCGCSGCTCECFSHRFKCPEICYLDEMGESQSIMGNEIPATSNPVMSHKYQKPQGNNNALEGSKERVKMLEKWLEDM